MNQLDLHKVKEYYQLKQQCRQLMIFNNFFDIIRRKQIGLKSLVLNELQIIWIKHKQLVRNMQTNSQKRIVTQCFHKLKETKYGERKEKSNSKRQLAKLQISYSPKELSECENGNTLVIFKQKRDHLQLRKYFFYFYNISRPKNKQYHQKLIEFIQIISKITYKKCFNKLLNHHQDKMLKIKDWLKN